LADFRNRRPGRSDRRPRDPPHARRGAPKFNAQAEAPRLMNHDEYQSLLDVSMEELRLRTEAHTAWGLGSFDRWSVDQDQGELVFSNADGTKAVAPVQFIGTFNTENNTWLWAWDNPSILEPLKVDSRKVKQYGEQHGLEQLTERKWEGNEAAAWQMAALAVKLCRAQGAYRGPAGKTLVFMTFGDVAIQKATGEAPS
jgi:hypothetical protein